MFVREELERGSSLGVRMLNSAELFQAAWSARRAEVEAALADYVSERGGLGSECPEQLREAMSYSLLAGGKRLRPVLTLLACEACGGDPRDALPAACAVELIHTYSLIHDDLPAMDDDEYRRGRPTNHKVFGEALAILAGDALLTLAFEVIARDVRPAAVAAACCADLAHAAGACGMVGGQVADLQAENQAGSQTAGCSPNGSIATENRASEAGCAGLLSQLQSIHRRKTGRLIRSALTLGGRVAQADVTTLGTLDHFGTCIGLAFQIADDLLDVTGTPEKLGKGVGKDAGLGKLTFPGLIGVERSRQKANDLVDEACQAVASWGERGKPLQSLARFVLARDH
jgi:geranylgeranyl diphosphate synthase type II